MIAADTSVVVAAFASWHEGHAAASRALQRKPRLPAQVLVESYSVLTRLPAPHRAAADLVDAFLAERFAGAILTLPEQALRALLNAAASTGIIGGAVYDALIAGTARHAGAILLTRDQRALATYERIGVRYELIR